MFHLQLTKSRKQPVAAEISNSHLLAFAAYLLEIHIDLSNTLPLWTLVHRTITEQIWITEWIELTGPKKITIFTQILEPF